jgi:hypothetical protein
LSSFHSWIPETARRVYSNLQPSLDARLAEALARLFQTPELQEFWIRLTRNLKHVGKNQDDVWEFLLTGFIAALALTPDSRATASRPDPKKKFRKNQHAFDASRQAFAESATTLRKALHNLSRQTDPDPGIPVMPSEHWEHCLGLRSRPFENLEKKQAFADNLMKFESALSRLEAELNDLPDAQEIFKGHPALASLQSSWRDFMRTLLEVFHQFGEKYEIQVRMASRDWIAIALVAFPKLDPEGVRKSLRSLSIPMVLTRGKKYTYKNISGTIHRFFEKRMR